MALSVPQIEQFQREAGASFLTYGPSAPAPSPTESSHGAAATALATVQIVETFDAYHAEYAAIRKGVGIFEQPQRGLVEVRGKDRAEFLHRMITHDTRTLQPGQARRAFLLSKQGRITADMIVLHEAERTLIDLDVFQASEIVRELDKYLFSEDVKLTDVSEQFHHIALHGPQGAKLIEHLMGKSSGLDAQARHQGAVPTDPPAELFSLAAMTHRAVTIDGHACTIFRRDDTGSPGLHLLAPIAGAAAIFASLADAVGGLVPNISHADPSDSKPQTPHPKPRAILGRGIGWLAYNTARVEAGVPLFHVDFGPDSLPGETGLLDDAVSFTKGCYLGQEIVARMKHLGHPKRLVVGLRCEDDRLPIAGSQVFDAESPGGAIIGGITSSTLSPLSSGKAVAIATMKWGKHTPGTVVSVPAEGAFVKATVCALPIVKLT